MAEIRNRVLTGHRPTGPRHLGHLAGTLQTWVSLQETHDCFFLIADLHVLTTDYAHPGRIRENSLQVLLDWLAAGIDPHKSTLVLQSALPQHSQLALLLGMLVTASRLQRNPTYKEQVKLLNLQPSAGLLSYPVLQAADILLYKADTVPVGEDQLPHLELAREIAHRFNQVYQPTFPEPQALLSTVPRLPGTDNRTMHTSYGNSILLSDTPEETTRKVMQMYTDPTHLRSTDPGHVEGNPVFAYLEHFDPDKAGVEELKRLYRAGGIGDVAVKRRLAEVLNTVLQPLRDRRRQLEQHTDDILEALYAGTTRAGEIATQTLAEVQDLMGLNLAHNLGSKSSLENQTGHPGNIPSIRS